MPKLTIEFGGLCLFVQRTSAGNKGLCVLMPRERMHGHMPRIRVKGGRFEPIQGSWDLTDLEGGKRKVDLPQAVRFTKLTGARVPKHLFAPKLSNLVAARFFLPYPKSVGAPYDRVPVRVRGGTGAATEVTGVYSMEYTFQDPVKIGRLTITNDTVLEIANIIKEETGTGTYNEGHPLDHLTHYFNVLDGFSEPPPVVETAAPYFRAKLLFYVDPVQCTVGTGCAEDEIDCGDD
ncbi:MAG TPA: hypothetical protein VFO55_09480 [Gemmatimonadaceae bacterium]|nr:hypothetical protein [Gemmatimonadaceae bacterium]